MFITNKKLRTQSMLTLDLSKCSCSTGRQKKSASARIGQPSRKQSADLQLSLKINTKTDTNKRRESINYTRNIHLNHHSSSIVNALTSLFCSVQLPIEQSNH